MPAHGKVQAPSPSQTAANSPDGGQSASVLHCGVQTETPEPPSSDESREHDELSSHSPAAEHRSQVPFSGGASGTQAVAVVSVPASAAVQLNARATNRTDEQRTSGFSLEIRARARRGRVTRHLCVATSLS